MLEGTTGTSGPLEEIKGRIREKGPITFAEFMDVALYWPEGGYYTSDRETWAGPQRQGGRGGREDREGREVRGDYVTNIDISLVFARVVARQVHEMWKLLGSPGRFDLVEAGAGRGWLTRGILETLEELYPNFHRTVRATLVEKNPHLPRLSEPATERTTWLEDLEGLEAPVTGCLLSNELIDALPFHRVVQGDTLKELYVGLDTDGRLVDVEGEPSTGELPEYFEALGIKLNPGQEAEVGLRARDWIERAGSLIDAGFVMTIDYGLPARQLYSPERGGRGGRGGTLMCHYRHTMNDDPYREVARQDITAHVDFTTLKKAGAATGLEITGFTTQSYFLLGLGIDEEFRKVGEGGEAGEGSLNDFEAIKYNQGIKELILPGGMGDTFKVLVQHKGVKSPALAGFSFKDMKGLL